MGVIFSLMGSKVGEERIFLEGEMRKILADFIQRSLGAGYTEEEIRMALWRQEWGKSEVEEGIAWARQVISEKKGELTAPPSPGKSWGDDFKNLTAARVLLYLGGLIVFLAAIIFVGVSWDGWGAVGRLMAILLPMTALGGVGVSLWKDKRFRRQGMVFIFTAALLWPLFLVVLFDELELFVSWNSEYGLAVSVLSLGGYLLMRVAIGSSIWSFLGSIAGLTVYSFLT